MQHCTCQGRKTHEYYACGCSPPNTYLEHETDARMRTDKHGKDRTVLFREGSDTVRLDKQNETC